MLLGSYLDIFSKPRVGCQHNLVTWEIRYSQVRIWERHFSRLGVQKLEITIIILIAVFLFSFFLSFFFFFLDRRKNIGDNCYKIFHWQKVFISCRQNRGRDGVVGFSGPMYPDHPISFNLYLSDVYERKPQRQMASQAIQMWNNVSRMPLNVWIYVNKYILTCGLKLNINLHNKIASYID